MGRWRMWRNIWRTGNSCAHSWTTCTCSASHVCSLCSSCCAILCAESPASDSTKVGRGVWNRSGTAHRGIGRGGTDQRIEGSRHACWVSTFHRREVAASQWKRKDPSGTPSQQSRTSSPHGKCWCKAPTPRTNHTLRTLPPSLSSRYAQDHDDGIWATVEAFYNTSRNFARKLATLPMKMGGVGIEIRNQVRSGGLLGIVGGRVGHDQPEKPRGR